MTWLHDRTEKDTFQLLVDSYRLRLDDEYSFHGNVDEDSVYGGAKDSRIGFRKYLRRAEKRPGLLPSWWTKGKQDECVRFGLSDDWSSLDCAVEKGDIIEHYGSGVMPMQLRMFAEAVYGTSINGPMGGSAQNTHFINSLMQLGEKNGSGIETFNLRD